MILLCGGDKATQAVILNWHKSTGGHTERNHEGYCIQDIGLSEDSERYRHHINGVLENGEPAVLEALRNLAQAKGGMGVLAKAAGRESLYCALSRRGNPKINDYGTTARLGSYSSLLSGKRRRK